MDWACTVGWPGSSCWSCSLASTEAVRPVGQYGCGCGADDKKWHCGSFLWCYIKLACQGWCWRCGRPALSIMVAMRHVVLLWIQGTGGLPLGICCITAVLWLLSGVDVRPGGISVPSRMKMMAAGGILTTLKLCLAPLLAWRSVC